MAVDRTYLAGDFKEIVNAANSIYELYGKTQNSQASPSLVRFSILMVDLY